ncbi:MAG: quinone-dependent dihydroorotate dehydrogenase [Thermoplasmatota archaeon]
MWYRAARPFLFGLDAERAHELAVRRLEGLGRRPRLQKFVHDHYLFEDPRLESEVWGLRFANPVGLAAGFDKNARLTGVLPALGFGFLEIGTVTSLPQDGNPRPRVFRLPEDRGLVNRLGFNNDGADAVAGRLAHAGPPNVPLGVNIGKSRAVPNEDATADYLRTFEKLFPYGNFFVVNVSSPNTPGLRDLQARESLAAIVRALQEKNAELSRATTSKPRPLLVKIAPDLEDKEIDDLAASLAEWKVDGIVATNTTVAREGLGIGGGGLRSARAAEAGGLSGSPLAARSTAVVARVYRATAGRIPIVGVGGIFTAADALAKIKAGASLVELYTGFIYGGPSTPSGISEHLAERLEAEGFAHLADAVGADAS